MQKIHFYLVPNRITVTTDMAGFTTEFRQVYTRTIKLYKGIDNTIEFEVRNADQRRQDVVGSTIVLYFFDADRKKLFEASGSAILSSPGLMSVVVPASTIANIDPQQLKITAKLVDYADTVEIDSVTIGTPLRRLDGSVYENPEYVSIQFASPNAGFGIGTDRARGTPIINSDGLLTGINVSYGGSGYAKRSTIGLLNNQVQCDIFVIDSTPGNPDTLEIHDITTAGVDIVPIDSVAERILYADSQFGLVASCELLDGYNSAPDFTDQLNVFNYEFDANAYFSEIGQFGTRINEDYEEAPTRSITCEIYPKTGFNGNVLIYATANKSNAGDVKWTLVDTVAINASTWDPVDDAVTVSGEYNYVRFKYMKYIEPNQPFHTLTGNLDKIIIRN